MDSAGSWAPWKPGKALTSMTTGPTAGDQQVHAEEVEAQGGAGAPRGPGPVGGQVGGVRGTSAFLSTDSSALRAGPLTGRRR